MTQADGALYRPRQARGRDRSIRGVAVDARRPDEHRGTALLGHDAIVGVPVIVCSTGCQEDIAQQPAQHVRVDVRMPVVRTYYLYVALDRGPLPPRACDDGAARIGPEMRELARAAGLQRGQRTAHRSADAA